MKNIANKLLGCLKPILESMLDSKNLLTAKWEKEKEIPANSLYLNDNTFVYKKYADSGYYALYSPKYLVSLAMSFIENDIHALANNIEEYRQLTNLELDTYDIRLNFFYEILWSNYSHCLVLETQKTFKYIKTIEHKREVNSDVEYLCCTQDPNHFNKVINLTYYKYLEGSSTNKFNVMLCLIDMVSILETNDLKEQRLLANNYLLQFYSDNYPLAHKFIFWQKEEQLKKARVITDSELKQFLVEKDLWIESEFINPISSLKDYFVKCHILHYFDNKYTYNKYLNPQYLS